jgi:3-deoxy-manno-octulosonate cytidylyltransferase (CMP-KDO synthetase)
MLIVIPARRHSTRLPEKLLRADTGMPLLAHTIAAARRAVGDAADRVWSVCDDEQLAQVARDAGANTVMVTEWCDSGTERIWRALPELPESDVIVNLQADEPEIPPGWLVACANALTQRRDHSVATIAVPISAQEGGVDDPNVVKVVTDHESCAMYFSRAPIPAIRQGGKTPLPRALRHVGLYAYQREFLATYGSLPPSPLEDAECLEQIRFLQAGARIRIIVTEEPQDGLRGIDTENDYQAFVARWRSASGA